MATSAKKAAARHAAKTGQAQATPNLPATQSAAAFSLANLPAGFKAKRSLQIPTLVMKTMGQGLALAFLSNLEVSRVPPKKKEEAFATVATVADTATGEQYQFLVPAVVESTLLQTFAPDGMDIKPDKKDYDARREVYAATDLRNKVFYIRNDGKAKAAGARHVNFTVIEGESLEMVPQS